jgi:hypothetical protein
MPLFSAFTPFSAFISPLRHFAAFAIISLRFHYAIDLFSMLPIIAIDIITLSPD